VALRVGAPGVTLERLVVLTKNMKDALSVYTTRGPVYIRSLVIGRSEFRKEKADAEGVRADNCIFLRGVGVKGGSLAASNCVSTKQGISAYEGHGNSLLELDNVVTHGAFSNKRCKLRHCTITGSVRLEYKDCAVQDSIVGQIEAVQEATIEHCNVFGGGYKVLAKPGKGCFSENPQFNNPASHDYRLMPKSPCRGKASDGTDVGCRYTPEMLQMLELAVKLSAAGAFEF